MAKRKTKTKRPEAEQLGTPSDYAIYPHRDHVKSGSIPFILADYGDRGAFSQAQIQTLSERHGLSAKQTGELSLLVGYSLDIDTHVSLVTINRSMVESRLNDSSLSKRSREKNLTVSEANALFDGFGQKVRVIAPGDETNPVFAHYRSSTVQPTDITEVSLEEAQRILQPNDRTKERDQRRLMVVESCCYIALDAGWSLTYTTDSTVEKNQRGGRLIALIKDVIATVTKNAQIASVHTLKSDIELVKRRFALRGDIHL